MRRHGLPRLASLILRWTIPEADRDAVAGDLSEAARQRPPGPGTTLWLLAQAASLAGWSLVDRLGSAASGGARGAPRLDHRVDRRAARGRGGVPGAGGGGRSPHGSSGVVALELRAASRSLRRSPGLVVSVVATLALGIAGTTTVFALVHGVLLAPLDFPGPERLVAVWPQISASRALFEDLHDAMDSVDGLAAWSGGARVLAGEGEAELLLGPEASAGFLETLGHRPALGRFPRPADSLPGAEPVVVLAHELFAGRFGGDEGVVGDTIRLDERPVRVIGVLPPGAGLLQPDARLVTALRIDPDAREYRTATYLHLVGRLRDGASRQEASSELGALAAGLQPRYSFSEGQLDTARVVSLRESLVGDRRPMLGLLMGAVTLVLLIACVNAGNLMLARQLGRSREMAVRAALGGSRARRLVFPLVEALVLALVGGAGGTLLAAWILAAVRRARPLDLPRLADVGLGPEVVVFTVVATAGTALLAGLLPGLLALRLDPAAALGEGRAASAGRRSRRAREALVVVEVAAAVVLVAAAGLVGRSLLRLTQVDPGLEPEGRLLLQVVPPVQGPASPVDLAAYYGRMVEAIGRQPGVVSAASVNSAPVRGGGWIMATEIDGRPAPDRADQPLSTWRVVSPGYFRTVGARLVRGRGLEPTDAAGAPGVVVVNETLARRHWPDTDAVGRRLRVGWDSDEWLTVVGVIADIRLAGPTTETPPTVYRPLAQAGPAMVRVGSTSQALVVRTGADPLAVLPSVRAAIRDADPAAAVVDPAPMTAVLRASLAEPRLLLRLLAAFGGVALLLAAVGIQGVVGHLVRERRRELGIRQALGAAPGQVVTHALGRGVGLGSIGLAAGCVAALLLGPALAGFAPGVPPRDPVSLGAVLAVLGLTVVVASWIPSRRAARIDPAEALRSS